MRVPHCRLLNWPDHDIMGLIAEGVGAMDAALWQTRGYLLTHKQFGVTKYLCGPPALHG